jgi:hypothetical protein
MNVTTGLNIWSCPNVPSVQVGPPISITEMKFEAAGGCDFTIWYPDKTVFLSERGNLSAGGGEYVKFTVPNVTGVYEYQAQCELQTGGLGVVSKSFHVSEFQNDTSVKLNRVKAVIEG